MCAGLVWELSEEPGTVLVYFARDDLGRAARSTVLCPGSATRARFARSPAELAAPGCTQVSLFETLGDARERELGKTDDAQAQAERGR
jgi:hypothetical protein